MRRVSIGHGTVGGPQFVFLEFWEVRRQIGTELPLFPGEKREHYAPKKEKQGQQFSWTEQRSNRDRNGLGRRDHRGLQGWVGVRGGR
ncbi:MAG: hypothetical protein HDKAJFGB_04085 [Anaerolineae bacterium]|nr:hypothetical protein [Anaerolineae bacterium]